jgi:glyoxylate reductase
MAIQKMILIDSKLPSICKKWVNELSPFQEVCSKTYLNSNKKNEVQGIISLLTWDLNADNIAMFPNLKIISNYAVGYNNIDIAYCRKHNIRVGNTPHVLTQATAEIALIHLLNASRNTFHSYNSIKNNKWIGFEPEGFLGQDLYGKTLGIFGAGKIGFKFAEIVKSIWNMNIIYNNRNKNEAIEKHLNAKYVSFDQLITSSDFISIHATYNKDNHHKFNLDVLNKMKSNSILINTARGSIIKEKDLYMALEKKMIFAAGLDVFENEPISKDNPLLKLNNISITAHIGSATYETRHNMAYIATANLLYTLNKVNDNDLKEKYVFIFGKSNRFNLTSFL